jgi:hypothetical protein
MEKMFSSKLKKEFYKIEEYKFSYRGGLGRWANTHGVFFFIEYYVSGKR